MFSPQLHFKIDLFHPWSWFGSHWFNHLITKSHLCLLIKTCDVFSVTKSPKQIEQTPDLIRNPTMSLCSYEEVLLIWTYDKLSLLFFFFSSVRVGLSGSCCYLWFHCVRKNVCRSPYLDECVLTNCVLQFQYLHRCEIATFQALEVISSFETLCFKVIPNAIPQLISPWSSSQIKCCWTGRIVSFFLPVKTNT